jgi:hypothetical protein
MYAQRNSLTGEANSWTGDWIFRRQRLSLIDEQFRASRPDIILFQDVMQREDSTSESDLEILAVGSLRGYATHSLPVSDYSDTQEIRSMAVAATKPLQFLEFQSEQRQTWNIGTDGYLTLDVLQGSEQPIVIFNVQMPSKIGKKFLWYSFVEERISEFVAKGRYCAKRLIVAGFLPADQSATRFDRFLNTLNLKDSSHGVCQVIADCHTATLQNEIYLADQSEDAPVGIADRILVSKSATIYSAARNLANNETKDSSAKQFGLTRMWASHRFGWQATIKLPTCDEDELGILPPISNEDPASVTPQTLN